MAFFLDLSIIVVQKLLIFCPCSFSTVWDLNAVSCLVLVLGFVYFN